MTSDIFNINWARLVRWNVPARLLNPKQLQWLRGLVYPVVLLYNQFLQYRKTKLYDLSITQQVCYLEKMLNDKYDFTQRRIRIEDALHYDSLFIFTDDELKPVYIFTDAEDQPVYLRTDGEAGDLLNDFVILVPIDVSFQDAEMRALMARNICGKRYKIERV